MNNYIMINGQQIELTQEQVERIIAANAVTERELSTFSEGDVVKVGSHEMVVLEHAGAATVLIRKDLIADDVEFGENNNYNGSNVEEICNQFGEEMISAVGKENVLILEVDLTSDDGLKDYVTVARYAALLTADQYRRYVYILDKHKLDAWWWLATIEEEFANMAKYATRSEISEWLSSGVKSGQITPSERRRLEEKYQHYYIGRY